MIDLGNYLQYFNPLIEKLSNLRRWVASLSHLWSRKVDVLNRGFSGYNSRWGLAIIDDVVISLRPNVIIIFFGANDAVVAEGSTYVPLEEYKLNIERMVLRIRKVTLTTSLYAIFLSTNFVACIHERCIISLRRLYHCVRQYSSRRHRLGRMN